jgi:hapalindole biogenesis HpiC1 cyclase-like protein
MKLKSLSMLIFGLALLAPITWAQVELPLLNGGFESPVSGPTDALAVNADNWVEVVSPSAIGIIRPANQIAGVAPERQQFLVLQADAQVEQTLVVPVIPGKSYIASYFLINNLGFTNARLRVSFLVDGVAVFSKEDSVGPLGQARRLAATYTHPISSLPGSSLTIQFTNSATSVTELAIDGVRLFEADTFESISTIALSSFEPDAPGTNFGTTEGVENWTGNPNLLSNHVVLPDGVNVTAAQGNMPINGNKWLECANTATGPGGLEAESVCTLNFYAETETLVFSWDFVTGESLGNLNFFDTALVRLRDRSVNFANPPLVSEDVLIETSTTSLAFNEATLFGGFGNSYARSLSAVQTHTITIPANLIGKLLALDIVVQNGSDTNVESALFVDNFFFRTDVFRTGTNEGPVMGTGVISASEPSGIIAEGSLSGGGGNAVKTAPEGSMLQVNWSDPSGLFWGRPILLLAELQSTGNYPAGFPQFGIALSDSNSFLLANGLTPEPFAPLALLAPAGQTRSFFVPIGLGLPGQSLLLQVLVPATFAANGILATTDMHEIVFTN